MCKCRSCWPSKRFWLPFLTKSSARPSIHGRKILIKCFKTQYKNPSEKTDDVAEGVIEDVAKGVIEDVAEGVIEDVAEGVI